MALGENMKRKTLIPTNDEELLNNDATETRKETETSKEKVLESTETKPIESIEEMPIKPAEFVTIIEKKPASLSNPLIEKNDEVTIEFKPSLRTQVNKITVILSGKLNIYNIAFIKEKIESKCVSYNVVEFLIKNIEDFDITFIQFSYYFVEARKMKGYTVSFDLEKPSTQLLNMLYLNNYSDLFIKKKLA